MNADKVDGFTITGKGTIDGNGLRYWKSFWLRRKVIPKCTNMDELRPRLLYISNAKNVHIEGVTLQNSPFWTSHYYRVERLKILGVRFFAPAEPVKAPSSDAIDLDVCRDVLVKNCYLSVNDDAIAMKGGKGPWADQDPNNGMNDRVIIEDCVFGFCHSCLTCGSESIHSRNIIMRRIQVDKATRLLWLKMRPDTPQNYEYITVEDITGNVGSFLYIRPWTQFFDLKGRKDMPMSYGRHIIMRNIEAECKTFFNVSRADDQYLLSDFLFENLKIKAENIECDRTQIENFKWKRVKLNSTALRYTTKEGVPHGTPSFRSNRLSYFIICTPPSLPAGNNPRHNPRSRASSRRLRADHPSAPCPCPAHSQGSRFHAPPRWPWHSTPS